MEDYPAPSLDKLEQRLEQDGVKLEYLTTEFLEAGDLGDADSLRQRLKQLDADEKRALVRAVDQQGSSGLLLAVRRGDKEVARVLLDAGANPNDADSSGATACHYASCRASGEMLELLLSAKADPMKVDDRGDSPLMWASGKQVVELLLGAGLATAEKGAGGKTALMYACERGDMAAARVLASVSSADLNAKDDAGNSAHGLAMLHGHTDVAEMLLGLGAEASAEPAARVVLREEALLDAARRGDAVALGRLLDDLKRSTPEIVSRVNSQVAGETPLLLACGAKVGQVVDMLLQAKADPNLADAFTGETPLHKAVLAGASCEVLMLLLEAKGDATQNDVTGRTAADVAASWSYSDAEELLRAAMEGLL